MNAVIFMHAKEEIVGGKNYAFLLMNMSIKLKGTIHPKWILLSWFTQLMLFQSCMT